MKINFNEFPSPKSIKGRDHTGIFPSVAFTAYLSLVAAHGWASRASATMKIRSSDQPFLRL